jgi:hypothetical protein
VHLLVLPDTSIKQELYLFVQRRRLVRKNLFGIMPQSFRVDIRDATRPELPSS